MNFQLDVVTRLEELERIVGRLKTFEALVAAETRRGVVELATAAETQAGADAERAVTPAGLAASIAGVAAYHSTTQTLNNASAVNVMSLDSERWDDASFHDTVTNNSRLTVPAGYGGWYIIQGGLGYPANNTGTYRRIQIRLNGSTPIADNQQVPAASQILRMNITAIYYLAAGDYVELAAEHNATTNLTSVQTTNSTTEFRMIRLTV